MKVGQCNPGVSYERDEPGAGHRGLAPARKQITLAATERDIGV